QSARQTTSSFLGYCARRKRRQTGSSAPPCALLATGHDRFCRGGGHVNIPVLDARFNELAGDGAGDRATAAAIFDKNAEGDGGLVGRGVTDEPRVRQVLVILADALIPLERAG